MTKIAQIQALEILDSRGTPTLEVILTTTSGVIGKAKIPSGASTGEHEAVELRDQNPTRYNGKGVLCAKSHVEGPLATFLKGKSVFEQTERDKEMIALDGTPNKSKFGANAILGVSLAIAKAAAKEKKLPLYQYLNLQKQYTLPRPMMNFINGGAHADNSLEIQEFMIMPTAAPTFSEALRWASEIFTSLKKILKKQKLSTGVGDEGGFAPNLSSDEEAIELLIEAITQAGYVPGKEVEIALDVAASSFYDKNSRSYVFKKNSKVAPYARSSHEQVEYLLMLMKRYPIIASIEDGLDENDWDAWKIFTKKAQPKCQIVGDDLFVTNPKFLQRGILEKAANAILIKLNQIGTLSETLDTIALAKKNNFNTIISHRSGETEDTFISDLACTTSAMQIKTGGLCRSERIAKYNRLLEIENELKDRASYFFKH